MQPTKTIAYKGIIYPVLIGLALVLIYWPTLRWLVNSWLSSAYYSHGFLIPVVSAAIIWTKRQQLKTKEPSLYGILWIVLAALLYTLNIFLEIRVLGPLSLLAIVIGLIWIFRGYRTVRVLIFPLGFLLFMIPFPFVPELAYRLQEISIYSSTGLLRIFGLPITSDGAEIYLRTGVLTVGIPCSGINSLVALLALTAVFSFILKGSLWKRVSLFVMAFPIAIIANILRIVSIILVAYFANLQTAAGWFHDISSPLFFVLAFLVIVLAGWLMKCKINYELLRK